MPPFIIDRRVSVRVSHLKIREYCKCLFACVNCSETINLFLCKIIMKYPYSEAVLYSNPRGNTSGMAVGGFFVVIFTLNLLTLIFNLSFKMLGELDLKYLDETCGLPCIAAGLTMSKRTP